jgi:hypothetical protein
MLETLLENTFSQTNAAQESYECVVHILWVTCKRKLSKNLTSHEHYLYVHTYLTCSRPKHTVNSCKQSGRFGENVIAPDFCPRSRYDRKQEYIEI